MLGLVIFGWLVVHWCVSGSIDLVVIVSMRGVE